MKKTWLLLLTISLVLCVCLSLFACGEKPQTPSNHGENAQTHGEPQPLPSDNPDTNELPDEQPPAPAKTYETALYAVEGFENQKCKVSNATETFDFTGLVTVSEDATWAIKVDGETMPDNTISLQEGDNDVTIAVTAGDGSRTSNYPFCVHRNVMCRVSTTVWYKIMKYTGEWDWEGSAHLGTEMVEEGNVTERPQYALRLGFDYDDFGGFDFSQPIEKDTYLTLTGTEKEELWPFGFTSDTETCKLTSFNGMFGKTTLTIPEYVTEIGDFSCSPEELTAVYWNAKDCKYTGSYGLIWGNYISAELYIGDTCECFPSGGIYGSVLGSLNITGAHIGTGLKEMGYISESVYLKDLKQWCEMKSPGTLFAENLYLNDELITDLVIPDGVTEIPSQRFYHGAYQSVTIPGSVKTIGELAFGECSQLKSAVLGEGVTAIGDLAFSGCTRLKSVELPQTLQSIGECAFSYEYASRFTGCPIVYLDIPDSVTTIGENAFNSCGNLTRISLGSGLKTATVADNAFADCAVFEVYDKSGFLFDVDPNACGQVAKKALHIYTPDSFIQVSYVKEVLGADGNVYVYYDYYNSETSSVDKILRACSGDNPAMVIPAEMTHIYARFSAFASEVTSVTIPVSILEIGSRAFDHCIALTDIYYEGTEAQWNGIPKGWNWKDGAYNCTVHCAGDDE